MELYSQFRHALLGAGCPLPVFNLIEIVLVFTVVFVWAFLTTIVLVYAERKIWGYMQIRLGPMNVGPKGVLQPIADGVKLFFKEDIIPAAADKPIFRIAPYLVMVPALMAYVVIPFGSGMIAQDLNIGILYILAITSIAVIGIMTGGWSSNNKYSLLGGMRSAAQIVSYEVPALLSLLGVIVMAGSLSMNDIVASQKGGILHWNFFRYPHLAVAAIVYLIAALAELNRTPFDLPEAESELVAGYNTEYSGMRFAMFFLAEWMNMFLLSGIATTLFLGGWMSPFGIEIGGRLGSFIWYTFKCWVLMFIMIWIRVTFPRFRVDQLMEFAWKVLIPVSLVTILISGAIVGMGLVK